MLWNKELKDELYFSHIPRTGGRYVSELIHANGWSPAKHDYVYFNMKEIIHLTYNEALHYYKLKKLPNNFSIIRNPVSRFVSASKLISDLPGFDKLDSKDYFNYFMNKQKVRFRFTKTNYMIMFEGVKNYNNNWFVFQKNFINHDTKLWKFENGFETNFFKWISDNVCYVKPTEYTYYNKRDYDYNKTVVLNKELKNNIMDFYKTDMDLWESLN